MNKPITADGVAPEATAEQQQAEQREAFIQAVAEGCMRALIRFNQLMQQAMQRQAADQVNAQVAKAAIDAAAQKKSGIVMP